MPDWKRASGMLLLCTVPLVVLILGLALVQYDRQREALLSDLARITDDDSHRVQALLAEADRNLGRMRNAIEAMLKQHQARRPSPLRDIVRHETARNAAGTFEASTLQAPSEALAHGNLLGVPDLASRSDVTRRRVDAALGLLDVMALEHSVGTAAVWSYYFSADGDFITIFPYANLQDLTDLASREKPVADAAALVAYWLGYDVFRLGTPERNPGRRPYWTRVYEDAAGAGLVVSHAAPIYQGDRFLGIVGTDIPTKLFASTLNQANGHIGRSAIVGPEGDILGLSGSEAGRHEAALRAAALKPVGSTFQPYADGSSLTRPLGETPFRLVHLVSSQEIAALLLPRFAPYGLILFGLAVTVLGIIVHLHRAYVAPSEALADYVTAEASGQPASALPRLPGAWQPRLTRIARAFAESRDYRSKLEESEARFEAAAAGLPDGFAILDQEGGLVFHNGVFAERLSAESRHHLAHGVPAQAFLGGEPWSLPPERIIPDGRWISTRTGRMPDGGTVLLLRDITEAKRSEIRIRESEARYRAVVDTQTEMVARYALDGRTTFVNDAYCRYMNMTAEELNHPDFDHFSFIVPEDRFDHDAHIERLTPGQPTATISFRSLLPDGNIYWEEWTDTGLFDPDGQLVELQAVGRNITEKKRAEEAARVSEERLAAFLDYAPLAMLVCEREGRIMLANAEAARRLGRPVSTILGRTYAELLSEAEARTLAATTARVIATGIVDVSERHHPDLDPYRDSLVIQFPLKDGTGAVTGVGTILMDRTQQKRAETELAQQRAALHQSEKLAALGSLLAGVAHELNNPLSIVVGYSGMLCELAPDEDTARRAREINVAADRCARIIKSFLAMARSKPVERKPSYLDDIIDNVIELAGYGLRRAGISVTRDEGKSLPPAFIDADQIHQVLMNLVLNAQQALAGRAEPSLSITTGQEDGRLIVTITDNGCGMNEAVRQRAFEPFFTTKPQGVGTGIGLSVCHGIIVAHGGAIELDSTVGIGTRFLLRLPVWAGHAKPADAPAPATRLRGRLMVVDDEPAIAHIVAQALRHDGVDVVTLASSRAALAQLLDEEFDALLTDLRMPDLTGEELIASLLARRPGMRGRIVAMTGDAFGLGLSQRFSDIPILEKPLDIGVLRATLAGVLHADADEPASHRSEAATILDLSQP